MVGLLMDWRLSAQQYASIRFCQSITRKTVAIIDDLALGRPVNKKHETITLADQMKSPFAQVWWEFSEKITEQRKKQTRDPKNDYDCSIVLAPFDNKWIFGNIYAEYENYRGLLLKSPAFEDYGYWNNVNRPEGMTVKNWEKRRKEWDHVLRGSDVLMLNGMSHELFVEYDTPAVTPNRIAAAMPTLEQRVRAKAAAVISDERSKYLHENDSRFSEENMERHIWEMMKEVREYLKTDDGLKRVSEEEIRISGIISPTIELPKEDHFMMDMRQIKGDDSSVSTYEDLIKKIET